MLVARRARLPDPLPCTAPASGRPLWEIAHAATGANERRAVAFSPQSQGAVSTCEFDRRIAWQQTGNATKRQPSAPASTRPTGCLDAPDGSGGAARVAPAIGNSPGPGPQSTPHRHCRTQIEPAMLAEFHWLAYPLPPTGCSSPTLSQWSNRRETPLRPGYNQAASLLTLHLSNRGLLQ